MRKILTTALMLTLLPVGFAVGQTFIFDGEPWTVGEGTWNGATGRLHQTSSLAPRAKINTSATQTGDVEIRFDARYHSGGEDGHAAFGLHVLMSNPSSGPAWGNGDSYLLWITYDPRAYGGSGAWAQMYRSRTGIDMERVEHLEIPAAYLRGISLANVGNFTLPVRIRINTTTGLVRVKDPVKLNQWWAFSLGARNLSGTHIGLRTSSVSGSFDNIAVVPVR